jgi:3-oxoacyl-[acyl-carrier-protein] synthase III
MGRYARIVSTAMYKPGRLISNDLMREWLQDSPGVVDRLEQETGIRQRWWAPEDWATSDLALPAAKLAVERAGKKPEDVDLIILGTDSPDYVTPATSVVLQHKLGARNAGTFDIGCACASFPTALTAGAGILVANPAIKTVLVVGVYLMHKLASMTDPMLFFYGDGAGAVVLQGASHPGFVTSAFQADGSYAANWLIPSSGTAEPVTADTLAAGRTKVMLVHRYPPEVNSEGWPRLVRQLAANGHFEVRDIDFAIFTQVRKPTVELVMEKLGLPMERTHTIMEEYGYTGSACLGMALDDAVAKQKIKAGDLVVLVGSGIGYNQAACAFRW